MASPSRQRRVARRALERRAARGLVQPDAVSLESKMKKAGIRCA